LRGWHGIGDGLDVRRNSTRDQAVVGVDDVGLDDGWTVFDQPMQQLCGRLLVAQRLDALFLQRSRNGGNVAQDLILPRGRTGSPMARAASYEAWAGFTTKSVRLTISSDRMIETIRAGVMVKMLQTSTSRICSRDPAAPRRRSSQSCVRRTANTTTSAVAMTRSQPAVR